MKDYKFENFNKSRTARQIYVFVYNKWIHAKADAFILSYQMSPFKSLDSKYQNSEGHESIN